VVIGAGLVCGILADTPSPAEITASSMAIPALFTHRWRPVKTEVRLDRNSRVACATDVLRTNINVPLS
jgi:hypothetical protein